MRIGIFGGTFNPIHNGHLEYVAIACNDANLDICHIVVSGNPWQKSNVGVSGAQRLEWVRMAVAEKFSQNILSLKDRQVSIVVDDREVKREGKTYTIDTVRSFKKQFLEADLVLIVGDDVDLSTWKDHKEIRKMVEVFTIPRANIPISSTMIRGKVSNGEPITGLLPRSVESSILDLGCYKS
jgi:nicotinate-nucleotide adenylyltransferase